MVDRYWRKIESVENNIENSMQISSILLKLKGYDEKLGYLTKIGNNENSISSNLTKIGNNENSISSNLIELNKIKNDMTVKIRKDIFKKTYIISNKTISFTSNKTFKIFSTSIYINYTNKGILNINTNYNYSFKNNINKFFHLYKIFDNNYKLLKKKTSYHKDNLNDSIIQEKFSLKQKILLNYKLLYI